MTGTNRRHPVVNLTVAIFSLPSQNALPARMDGLCEDRSVRVRFVHVFAAMCEVGQGFGRGHSSVEWRLLVIVCVRNAGRTTSRAFDQVVSYNVVDVATQVQWV
jgi:hypothetical protein